MTRKQFETTRTQFCNDTDREALRSINMVLALLDIKRKETEAAGAELEEKSEVLDAIDTAKDMVEEIRITAEAFHAGEATA